VTIVSEADPFDVRLVRRADGLLRPFNEIGLLSAADVHVARRLLRLGDATADDVGLAVALAVRAPRLGHVYADLATVRETATVDSEEPVDLSGLPWPEARAWSESAPSPYMRSSPARSASASTPPAGSALRDRRSVAIARSSRQ